MKKLLALLAFSIISFSFIYGQNGTIRGTVIDDAIGETMPGVNVVIDGTTNGAVTDLDGAFSISAAPGTYNLRVSFISFEPQVISDVNVKAGEVTNVGTIRLSTDSEDLQEVVITASMVRNNETALLTMKKKSANMIDGISSASFRKIGDSDAASSMKRVPGVSIEGGKYIFVRGLGDRYTKTLLNGMEVPGLDPDRNTIQMDIFPTNVLDNIIVHKTFVASLPADFTGGAVDITTKAFPESKQWGLSGSIGYNPQFHLNSEFLTYEGGSTDFLGFDDGTREIPVESNIPQFAEVVGSPNGPEGQRYQNILASFNPTMAAMEQTSLLDFGFGANYGNQISKENHSIGYNVVFSYKNSTEYYDNVEYGRYGLSADPNVYEMDVRELQTGRQGINTVLLSGMAGVAYKTKVSKFKLNLLHLQNGESRAGIYDYFNDDQGAEFRGFQHNLEYSQRSLTNVLLGGEHFFSSSNWDLSWNISPTFSVMDDPDVRFTRYEIRPGNELFIGTEAGLPQRIWRDLSELNLSNNVQATKTFQLFDQTAKFSFGGAYNRKERDYNIRSFNFLVRGFDLTGDPNELFADQNLWPINGNPNRGLTFDPLFIPTNPNEFNSVVNNTAGFVQTEFTAFGVLKTIIGVRLERFVQQYTGQDQLGLNVLDNDEVLNTVNLFPSLNLVYAVNERQNLRFSYTQTTARPSMKELSYAEIYDPLTGRTFIGGLFTDENQSAGITYWDGNLTSTFIQNLDLRWEVFPSLNSTVSIGGFYKHFEDPIEIIQFTTLANAFQPRNVGDGEVFGGELELRAGLEGISSKLKNFGFTANFTATYSRIRLSSTEFESRVENARAGQEIDEYRAMAGQAPFIVNAGFSFNGSDEGFGKNLQCGLYYNVQSSTLQFVGIVDRPDIYTVPFHSLNFNGMKKFGKEDRMQAGLKVTNLLNDDVESVFKSYEAEDQFFSRLQPGTTVTVSFGYSF